MGRRGGARQHWSAGANRLPKAKNQIVKPKLDRGQKVSSGEANAVLGNKKRRRSDSGAAVHQARMKARLESKLERKRQKLESRSGSVRAGSLTGLALMATEDGGDRMARDSEWRKNRKRVNLRAQVFATAFATAENQGCLPLLSASVEPLQSLTLHALWLHRPLSQR
eukprot:SAG31_NODE_7063_length_1799_cov_1.926471_2_plen_167_part_00